MSCVFCMIGTWNCDPFADRGLCALQGLISTSDQRWRLELGAHQSFWQPSNSSWVAVAGAGFQQC